MVIHPYEKYIAVREQYNCSMRKILCQKVYSITYIIIRQQNLVHHDKLLYMLVVTSSLTYFLDTNIKT